MSIKRIVWIKLVVVLVFSLILLRIAAPFAIQKAGNYVLNNTEGIEGSIGDVDLHLYRGAYAVENIEIRKTKGDQETPLVSVARMDISILWSALIRGHIVSEIVFDQPHLYILDTPSDQTEENKEVTNEDTWIALVDQAVPFSIDRISINQGRITLRNLSEVIDQETFISAINGTITNITNSKNSNEDLVAQVVLTAKLMDKSNISVNGSADPFSTKPSFDINVEMQKLSVKDIEGLIAFYAPFDLEAGHIDGAMELAAKNGALTGYVKAGIYKLSVFSWHQDVVKDGDNPFQVLFEAITDLFAEILENDESKLVATRVPIEGPIDNTEISVLSAIAAVLRNAFLKTIEMQIEDIVSFEQLPDAEQQPEAEQETSSEDK